MFKRPLLRKVQPEAALDWLVVSCFRQRSRDAHWIHPGATLPLCILTADMSGSTSPPPSAEAVGTEACFPPGYKYFKPEEHGLERGFRLTAFSDMKGWGCKVPQEALLKLLAGLEADRADGTGKAGDEASDFSQQLPGPRLGRKRLCWSSCQLHVSYTPASLHMLTCMES